MLEAKAKDQGHKAQVLSKKKKKKRSSQKFFRRSPKKKKKKKKKKVFTKFFKRSPRKNAFQKIFQALHKILTFQKIVLSSSRGQANFRGLEASRPRPRPRPRTSKSVLEDVLEAKDVLEDSTSADKLISGSEFPENKAFQKQNYFAAIWRWRGYFSWHWWNLTWCWMAAKRKSKTWNLRWSYWGSNRLEV